MSIVYLGLGSNQGDRRTNIEKALEEISTLESTSVKAVSSFIETKAQGFDGADFLNCCARVETSLGPAELLHALKNIEKMLGRESLAARYDDNGARIYSDRPIDIDILLYGDVVMDEDGLQIPHPRMLERDFVMIPLREVIQGETIIDNKLK